MTYRSLLPSAVSGSGTTVNISETTWVDVCCNLMSEEMVFGCRINGKPARKIEAFQFPLFRYNPELVGSDYWLIDIANEIDYCAIGEYGQADFRAAGERHGIRPYICIK